jgi:hypothetical protein
MNKCTRCRKSFNVQPIIASHNDRMYCSLQCLPQKALEQDYSYQYFQFVEAIQSIQKEWGKLLTNARQDLSAEEIKDIYWKKSFFEWKRELINNIDNLVESNLEFLSPDYENYPYKYYGFNSMKTLHDLKQQIIEWQWDVRKPSVYVSWYEMPKEICEEIIRQLEEYEGIYILNDSIDFEVSQNLIFDDLECRDECFSDIMSKEKLSKNKDYFIANEVRFCEGCGWFEDPDDFTYDEKVDLFLCQSYHDSLYRLD